MVFCVVPVTLLHFCLCIINFGLYITERSSFRRGFCSLSIHYRKTRVRPGYESSSELLVTEQWLKNIASWSVNFLISSKVNKFLRTAETQKTRTHCDGQRMKQGHETTTEI